MKTLETNSEFEIKYSFIPSSLFEGGLDCIFNVAVNDKISSTRFNIAALLQTTEEQARTLIRVEDFCNREDIVQPNLYTVHKKSSLGGLDELLLNRRLAIAREFINKYGMDKYLKAQARIIKEQRKLEDLSPIFQNPDIENEATYTSDAKTPSVIELDVFAGELFRTLTSSGVLSNSGKIADSSPVFLKPYLSCADPTVRFLTKPAKLSHDLF